MSSKTIEMFYNTTRLRGKQLEKKIADCLNQKEKILEIFKNEINRNLSAEDIALIYRVRAKKRVPITSIRRAISDLYSEGKLIKNGEELRKMGQWGDPIHTWRLNVSETENINGSKK